MSASAKDVFWTTKKQHGLRNKRGAGDRDRTGMASLEGWGSTIELHPHVVS